MKVFLSQSAPPVGKLGQRSSILGHHLFVLEMIYFDKYCNGFMILWGYSVHSNTIYNSIYKKIHFLVIFKILFLFVEIYLKFHNLNLYT